MLLDVLRSSELWTAVLVLAGTFLRPVLHINEDTWHTIQISAVGYIVSRLAGKTAKATIK